MTGQQRRREENNKLKDALGLSYAAAEKLRLNLRDMEVSVDEYISKEKEKKSETTQNTNRFTFNITLTPKFEDRATIEMAKSWLEAQLGTLYTVEIHDSN